MTDMEYIASKLSKEELLCQLAEEAAELAHGATMGSLFDGIGGFPLCWETIHGRGSARWASEIEECPIAVTKFHFDDK